MAGRISASVKATEPGDKVRPLRPIGTRSGNLPLELTTFIGRNDEIAEVRSLLSQNRLITLTGSGGCGKTRLALQAAAAEVSNFRDGIWWIDLGPLSDSQLVANTIASTLDIQEAPFQGFQERLETSLSEKALLLIIDNCEHLIDACAELIEALLRGCPSLKVIATSREPLGVAGETSWRVPSMSLPDEGTSHPLVTLETYDAVRLFIERAQRARPNFCITEENAPHVLEICRRLDGIPLAIELAAARTRLLSPQQIAQGLGDRFRLLSGGGRTAVARQQTLLASVEWSYKLLSDTESMLLNRLAVFSGTFTLDGAEAVCSDEAIPQPEVLDLLASLVDKSLVQVEELRTPTRYGLLETIRQFANQKLMDSEESTVVRGRHLDFYVKVAEAAQPTLEGTEDLMDLLESLDLDCDNLRGAMEWARSTDPEKGMRIARDLWGYWYIRGYWTEGSIRCEVAASDTEERPSWRARTLSAASVLATTGLDATRAQSLASEAHRLAQSTDDETAHVEALYGMASAYFFTDPRRARVLAREALELAERLGNHFGTMRATYITAITEATAGNFQESQHLLEEWLRLNGRSTNNVTIFMVLTWNAMALTALGDLDSAEAAAEEGLGATRKLRNFQMECANLCMLASIDIFRGEYERAAAILEEVRVLSIDHPHPLVIALWPFYLETLNFARGEVEGGADSLETGLAFFERAGAAWFASWLYSLQADSSRALGDSNKAHQRAERALELGRASGNPCSIGRALRAEGSLLYTEGDFDSAEDRFHEALRLLAQVGSKPDVVATLEWLGQVAAQNESGHEAARLLGATDQLRKTLGYKRFASDEEGYERALSGVRKQLEPQEFEAAWNEGTAMSLEQTVAYAARGRGERKRPSSGWKSLTPTETEVVRLVAEGLTNPEIGKRLFISPGTVKNHLSHVFAKLGISTRSELAAQAARRKL